MEISKKVGSRLWGGNMVDLCNSIKHMLSGRFNSIDKLVIISFFVGRLVPKSIYREIYRELEEKYIEGDHFNFDGIKLPKIGKEAEREAFIGNILDIVYPSTQGGYKINSGDGSYEHGKVKIEAKDIVVDAGANIGAFSALAASRGAVVYAFEPIEEIKRDYLDKTAVLNPGITVVQKALSDKVGRVGMNQDLGNIGGSSMVRDRKNESKIFVESDTLDNWVLKNNILRVDFLKADIEGAERLMLSGGQNVLKKYAPKLAICTYHLPDDREVLTKLILKANPKYKIEYSWKKLYGHTP
jgi:FkbM family methyltransferase